MDLLERTAIIGEIARRKKGGRLGKTAMMKLLHLLQDGFKVPLGYRFTLYNYGPYDTEVMSDIEFAESLGQISVSYDGPDQGYRIQSPTGKMARSANESIKGVIDRLMDQFGSLNARELELRSTLLFLSREFKENELLVNRLRELKPKYSDHETIGAVAELRKVHLIH